MAASIPLRKLLVLGSLAASLGSAHALTVTPDECSEGAEFISNAAAARDNGIKADDFINRMEEDFMLVRSVPRDLRWFARDEDDEHLLRMAVMAVFRSPRSPSEHGSDFLMSCLISAKMSGPSAAAPTPSPTVDPSLASASR